MSPVLARIALSFAIAGAWIAGATLLGERLGSRKAGLIANLPSNLLISLLFMSLTKGSRYASAATAGVPIGMMIDTVFLAVFILLLRSGPWKALVASLAAWAAVAVLVLAVLPPIGFGLSILVYLIVAAILFLFVDARLGKERIEKKSVPFSWRAVALRAFFAGSVVAGAVAVAQVAPPYMTGVLATFPAVLTSTMVILTMSQGVAFAQAAGKVMILSSANIILYSTCAGFLFPKTGPWLGTVASFAASFFFILLLGKLTARMR